MIAIKLLLVPVLFVLVMEISSCRCHDEACAPGGLGIEVKGFDSSELNGVVLRRYDTVGFYAHLLEAIPCREIVTDTVNGVPHTLLALNTLGNYDWEIIFPVIQKTFRIYDPKYEYQSQRICNSGLKLVQCITPITAYTQDGILHSVIPPQPDHSDLIQIQR